MSSFSVNVCTNTSGRRSSACRSDETPSIRSAVRQDIPVSIGSPALILGPPLADHVEVLEREANRVHVRWQLAQAGLVRCRSICSRIVSRCAAPVGLQRGVQVRRRGRRRRADDVFEHPLPTQDRRCCRRVRRREQDRALAEKAAARRVLHLHAAEPAAEDISGSHSAAPAAR